MLLGFYVDKIGTSREGADESETKEDEQVSVFEYRELEEIKEEIRQTYLADERPWVIGYSGGKDSITCL